MQRILSFLFLVITVIFLAATLIHPPLMQWSFFYVSYYLIAALFCFWLWTLFNYFRNCKLNWKEFFKKNSLGVIFSFILTLFISLSVKPYYRVMADETKLLGVSKSMLCERATYNTVMGKWHYFNFYPIKKKNEERPLLFPFFTHLVHLILGYRTTNPFVVNFISLWVFFSLIFILIRESLGAIRAFAAVFFVAAQPIVSQCAASAGFDLLSIVFIFLNFAILKKFLEAPSSTGFELLWITLVMLCQVRYESGLYFVIALLFLWYFKYIKMGDLKNSFLYSLTPLFFLPLLWQRILTGDISYARASGVPMFSFHNFLDQALLFVKSFWRFDFYLPYATVINILGFVGLIYFCRLMLSKQWLKQGWQKHLLVISITCVLIHWIMIISVYHGEVTRPAASRYYCFFFSILSLIAVAFLASLSIFKARPYLLLLISIILFSLYHPVAIANRFSNTAPSPRQYRMISGFLKKLPYHDILIITRNPGKYTVMNFGAIDFHLAKKEEKKIRAELKQHWYRDVLVIQDILYKTKLPSRETTLTPKFRLEPVFELREGTRHIRISKLKHSNDYSPKKTY